MTSFNPGGWANLGIKQGVEHDARYDRAEEYMLVVYKLWGGLVALATLEFGTAMLTIGAMSYLGFGQAPPAPEWGRVIAQGQVYLQNARWLSVLPGLMFVVVVIALNRVSRAIGSRHE